jgi:predicted ATPase
VQNGAVTSNQGLTPAASEEKLYLVNASGLAAFEPVYRALSSVALYNPVPDEIRGVKTEKGYGNLDRTGSALAETISRMQAMSPDRFARVIEYLQRIAPSVHEVLVATLESQFSLRFTINKGGGLRGMYTGANASDGTLRALAVLVALFQRTNRPLMMVGLEEPEAGLHPAAAGVLYDALLEASQFEQVIVTSHSPDLLDREDTPADALRAVAMCDGETIIGNVNQAGRTALREGLYTPGELMRMDQLRPEVSPDCVNAK